MKENGKVIVLVTTDSEEEAGRIANTLLKERKAACVNIVPEVNSLFWWQGKIDSANESLLIVKTKASLLDDVVGIVKANHHNHVPEVIALPIIGGNPDYLNWMDGELK